MSALKKQNQKENKKKKSPRTLRVIIGDLHPSSQISKRIYDFWVFCHSTFWSTENFTQDQEREFKKLIKEYFTKSKDADATFSELVQRAIIAKRYVKRRHGRYIAKPIDWLNINYKFGLAGTASWYNDVVAQRQTVPHYNEGVALLAEAMLAFSRKRNLLDVAKYRQQFIDLKQFDLLFLYTNSVVHYQYINY